jgi:uncharacterized membrane protein YdjX (TVP38/TMEM64 family)
MKNIAERIADLIDLKSIVTVALISTLCVLAYRQNIAISTELFAATISSIITYFFVKKPRDGQQ